MSELNDCLKCLYEHYAVFLPPIDSKTAQQASVTLVKAGVPPIPLDYVSFLSKANGMSWNGIVFFALQDTERNKGAFHHPGILQNKSFCQSNAVMHKKLWLGYGCESLIVYDFLAKEYQVLDRYTYQKIYTFPTLIALLQHITKPLKQPAAPGSVQNP